MATRREARTRLDPQVRRQSILDAAERVVSSRSGNEVTFEAVADEAGVSRALVYNYFGDRTGLLVAVEMRTMQRLDAELLDALDPTLGPAEQLRPLAEAYLRFARENGRAWRALTSAGITDHPAVQAARANRVARLAAVWGGTPEALVAAVTVTRMLEAASVEWVESEDPDAAVDVVCRILTHGLEG